MFIRIGGLIQAIDFGKIDSVSAITFWGLALTARLS
jgi:hypothetical protein